MEKKEKHPSILPEKPSLFYLNAEVGSVFHSQVAALLKQFYNSGFFARVTLLCGCRNAAEIETVKSSVEGSGVELRFFKTHPFLPFFDKFQIFSLYKALRSCNIMKTDVIHVRGELLFLQALPGLRSIGFPLNRLLADIRGAGPEELMEFQQMTYLIKQYKLRKYKQAFAMLHNAGKVSAVSIALTEYLKRKSPALTDKLHVVPCCAGNNFSYNPDARKRIRDKEGIQENDCVLIFSSGGSAAWQEKEVVEQMASNSWTIINMSRMEMNGKKILNRFVPYKEVADWLSAADAAIMFRSHSVVNEVACPVKFCEYVCAGLPVIANTEVAMVTEWLKSHKAGFFIRGQQDVHTLHPSDFFTISRKELSVAGIQDFGVKTIATKYLQLYASL